MTIAISVIIFVLLVTGFVLVLKLDTNFFNSVIKDIFTQKQNETAKDTKDTLKKIISRKESKLFNQLKSLKSMLEYTHQESKIAVIIIISAVLLLIGIVICVSIGNMFLIPVLAISLALVPFIYIKLMYNEYQNLINIELETALSIITMSYISNNNLITAITENLPYINEPIKPLFEEMVYNYSNVTPSLEKCILNMKYKLNSKTFERWCDILIQCINNHQLKYSLTEVLNRLTDEKIILGEIKNILSRPRSEFFSITFINVLFIPLLFVLNRDWFNVIFDTTVGKIVFAINVAVMIFCSIKVILITNITNFEERNKKK